MDITIKSVRAGNKRILNNINLTFPVGSVAAILGKNGSGKSTLLNSITGHPSYKLDGQMTTEAPVFMGFQKPVEIPETTTGKFLLYLDARFGVKSESIDQFFNHYAEAISILSITKEMMEYPLNKNLSGGENKRLELLQMQVMKPKTVLLDEIDTGLDLDMLITIGSFLTAYHKEYNPTMVIVTHNLTFLKQFPVKYVVIIDEGSIATKGEKEIIEQLETDGFKKVIESL